MRHETHEIHVENDGGKSIFRTLGKISGGGLALCFLGIVGTIAGFFWDRHAFWTSYIFAFAFWMSLSVGFASLTYLHHSIRATWTLCMLRVIEAGNKTLAFMFVAWIPLAIGVALHQVYKWSNPDIVAHSVMLTHKSIYLNPTAWLIRGVIYFAFWWYTLGELNKSSLKQDETRNEILGQQRASFGASFGVIHILLLTLAVTDWYMSLDPVYYSTIYAVIYMMAGVLAGTAIGAIFLTAFSKRYPFSEIVTPLLTKNVGNMLLGFTMFWSYTSLAQFLIQWSANLPEEISFYAVRFEVPLVFVGAAVVIFQFVVPFLALLSGRTKRTYSVLLNVSILIVFMRVIDCWWQITPFLRRTFTGVDLLLDLAALAGIGGIWMYVFIWNLKRFPSLIATHDPRLIESKANAHA